MDSSIMPDNVQRLTTLARQIRWDVVQCIYAAGGGHAGGSLSAADICTALYFHVLNIDPARPHWEERDRFILSKGHACPVLYACLARRGYFPVPELAHYRHLGHFLQGHPDMTKIPGWT